MGTLKLNNLRKELLLEIGKHKQEVIKTLLERETIQEVTGDWLLSKLFTATTINKKWKSLLEVNNYIYKRADTKHKKRVSEALTSFDSIINSGVLIEATITVEWRKSSTWGSNPKAKIRWVYTDLEGSRHYKNAETSSIGGCGYDKLSTAVAEALNSVAPIKRSLYKKKNTFSRLSNGEVFGYGSGYGVLPYIEGGVGVSCYPDIFKAIGYAFETIASGDNFDVFKITKQ